MRVVPALKVPLSPLVGGRTGEAIGFSAILALVLWVFAYASGVFPWLGYAWLSRSSIGIGPGHFTIGEERAGSRFGLGTFVFLKGQTIVVSYDAEIARGCLWMHVLRVWHHDPDARAYRCITASGQGEWRVPVTQTGLYDIIIEASPGGGAGPGWQMTYTAWWGARW